MHITTVTISAPNEDDLKLAHGLADNPSFVEIDLTDFMITFTFCFDPSTVKADDLLESTMDRFDIYKLDTDPAYEHINVEEIKEYPSEVA